VQKLKDDHGYPKVKRALRYSWIRLGSRPETASLAEEILAERNRTDQANEAYEQAVEERVAATALVTYLDTIVDDCVMAISRDVAVTTGNKTDDPYYKPLFPVAPSTATKPVASDSQNLFVKALIDRIETDPQYESLRGRAATLKAAQADLDTALADRKELLTPEIRASVDLATALDNARRTYNKLLPRLSLIFEKKAFVETFFLRRRKSKRSDDASTDTEAPEADGTGSETLA